MHPKFTYMSHILLLPLVIVSFAGCQDSTISPPTAKQLQSKINTKPLSESEINSIIDRISSSISNYDRDQFKQVFNLEQILDYTTSEFETDSQTKNILKEFKTGFLLTLERRSLADEIFDNIEHHSNFKLMRSYTHENEQRLFYRFSSPEVGLNYFELILGRDANKNPQILDMINYATGEKVSVTLKRVIIPLLQSSKLSTLEKIAGKEAAIVKHGRKIKQMSDEYTNGDFEKALNTYHALPDDLKKQKFIQITRIRIAQEVGGDEYVKATEAYLENFPDDPTLHLMSIDACIINNQIERCIEHLHLLDKQIGGDPYLKVMEASVTLDFMDQPDLEHVEQLITQAMEEEPDMTEGIWLWLNIALQKKDHPKVLQLLQQMDQLLEYSEWELESVELYSEFIKSPQYQQWLEYLKQKEQESNPENLPEE